jgi:molybdopterin/thiamine biosynthesis adenylyltransferase
MIPEGELRAWAERLGRSHRQAQEAALEAGIFPECYERNFPSLSPAEQLRLLRSRVLVAGLGGLGGRQAELLARLGVGSLRLADGDVFTPPNLNRQMLATRETLGLNKARVVAGHLLTINDALLVEAFPDFLTPKNLESCLSGAQVALDALDTLAARRSLFAAAQKARVAVIHGAVNGVFGHVLTLMPGDPVGLAHLEAGGPEDAPASPPGVLAPTVALVASLQVQEAVRWLLGRPPLYRGRLAHFDGETGRLEMMDLK